MKKNTKRLLSLMLSLILVVGLIPGSLMTAHAYIGEIETITDEELLEVMEVDLRIGHEIIASSESTSFSKMSNPGHWELKLSKQDNENRMQYYIVLHLYDYDVFDGYIDFMYDMKPAADPANSVSFQVSVHGDCKVGFVRALTTDKEKVYGSSLDIIFAEGATLRTKQIVHQGTGQWGSDIELNLRGVPGAQPGILYTKEIMNKYYFINWPQGSEVVTYADNLIIINYDTPTNGGPLFTHGEDYTTVTQVQFTETVDLFLNTRYGQFPIFEEHTNEKLAQKYQYIEDDGITAFSDLRSHIWLKESGLSSTEYTVGDSIDYYFFPELSMLDFLLKNGINEQFKGNTTSGFKVESGYRLTNLTERQDVASGTVTGIEKEYSHEEDNFVKVAGINGEEYFTFETPGLYELRSTVKLMHNGHTVDSAGEVYHFYVNPAPAVLDGIEITRSAASMAHANGQEFDKSKIEVTAKYSDGSSKILDAAEYDVTYQNGATLKTGDTSVTISYTEDDVTKTATQTVSVADALHAFEFKSLDDLDFGTVEVGYPSVAYKNIIVKNTGSDFINLDYKISDTSKFRLSPYSDDLNAIEEGTSHTLQVHPVDGLPAGVYNETIRVYGMGALAGQEHTFNLKFVVSDGHEHTYTTDFNKSNEFYHWRECTDPACTASDKGRKDVTPHNWDIEHPVVVDPATCTEDGVGKIDCTICDAYQNTTVYATGHDWGEWPSYITPRCNEAPITITRTCENDESHTDSKTINGIHMAMDWTTDETHHWKVCGYCETEILVEKDAHKDTNSDNKCDVCEYDMTPAVQPTEININKLPSLTVGDNITKAMAKNVFPVGLTFINNTPYVAVINGVLIGQPTRAEADTNYYLYATWDLEDYTEIPDASQYVVKYNGTALTYTPNSLVKDNEQSGYYFFEANGNIYCRVWIYLGKAAPAQSATEYDITVTGGTASANKAVAGTEITLTVEESAIPAGKVFDKWEVVSGGVTVTDGKFTMPANAVEINATYKDAPVSHICDIKPVAKVEPSCTEGGKEAYYKCEGCGKCYEDALGAKEITDIDAWGNLEKLGHTESDWKSDKDNHWKECTVTACGVIIEDSKAAHKDDNKDGKCDVCEYNVGVPGDSSDDDKPSDNPQTDDNSMIWLWCALLFVSGAGVVATTVYCKKRSSAK